MGTDGRSTLILAVVTGALCVMTGAAYVGGVEAPRRTPTRAGGS